MRTRFWATLLTLSLLFIGAPVICLAQPAPSVPAVVAAPAIAPSTGCTAPAGCDIKIPACEDEDEGRSWSPYAGAELVFLSPHFTGPVDSVNIVDTFNGTNNTITTNSAVTRGLTATPRVWVGLVGQNCWGVRARYWQLNQASSGVVPFDPSGLGSNTFGYVAQSGLKMYAADLEITKQADFENWQVLGSAGVRDAHVERFGTLSAGKAPLPLLSAFGLAQSGAKFDGVGPTFGIQALRPICDGCCGNWGFYTAGRGSALWGSTSNSYAVTGAGVLPLTGGFNTAYANNGQDQLTIGEFQVGVQWTYDLQCCCARAFARLTFEYQHWHVTGNSRAASTTTSFVAGPGGSITSTAIANGQTLRNLDLTGIGLATGFYW